MLQVQDEKVPLRQVSGVVFVGDSRVTLGCVVEMFDNGASPEVIVEEYDALSLADVYAVATYYLRNRETVRTFLREQASESDAARESAETEFPSSLREKLLRARRGQRGPCSGG
jgi:uncharacterized protein (DUF433 family)